MEVVEQINATKTKIGDKDAWNLLKDKSRLWVVKGKKVLEYNLKKDAPKSEILGHIMGRSGNLRAPTFIKGKDVFVGFSEDGFKDFAGL